MAPVEALIDMALLEEISSKAIFAEQQLSLVRGQLGSKKREERVLQLSQKELNSLPKGTGVWEGVGKMFVQTSIPDVTARQEKEGETVTREIKDLEKKMHYLDQTAKNSRLHIEGILKQGQ
ncbi:Prefoldin [Piedraia hortae CBS 480.64]|uniref:Prefoldin n=1 Tax=Piedraia hortae CBS 480.64 TaxID=1314780 RepID=A0A6A7C5B2_9PEZI|nr:Prefoldin [Piedraia hortae CBS 480.64]